MAAARAARLSRPVLRPTTVDVRFLRWWCRAQGSHASPLSAPAATLSGSRPSGSRPSRSRLSGSRLSGSRLSGSRPSGNRGRTSVGERLVFRPQLRAVTDSERARDGARRVGRRHASLVCHGAAAAPRATLMATFGAAVQRVALRAADSWPLYVTRQVDVAFRPLHFRRALHAGTILKSSTTPSRPRRRCK